MTFLAGNLLANTEMAEFKLEVLSMRLDCAFWSLARASKIYTIFKECVRVELSLFCVLAFPFNLFFQVDKFEFETSSLKRDSESVFSFNLVLCKR